MRTYKATGWISLFGSIIILMIGLSLYFVGTTDTGFTFSRNGNAGTGTINVPGCIGLGIVGLLFSWWNFKEAKNESKEREILLKKENADLAKRKKRRSHQ